METTTSAETTVLDAVAAAVLILQDQTIRYANPTACQLLGYSAADVAGLPLRQVFTPDAEATASAGHPNLHIGTLTPTHTHPHNIMIQLQPIQFDGQTAQLATLLPTALPVNQRAAFEVNLRRSEQLQRTLIDNFPNGMVALFDHELRYTVAGGLGLRDIGLPPADLEGKRLRDIFPPEVYERDEPALRAALAGETRIAELAFGDQYFEVRTMPVYDDGGQIIGGLVVSQNVTQRVLGQRAQVEQARLQTAFEKQRELNDLKTRLMRTLSHEFRTPLSLILTASELLQHYADQMTDERRAEHYAQITEQVTHLAAMLRDINTVVQGAADDTLHDAVPLNLVDLCRAVFDRFTAERGSDHVMHFNGSPAEIVITGEAHLLEQAVSNLLANAILYSPGGTTVGLTVHIDESAAVVTVADEGVGIAADDLPHIFEPFFRTPQADMVGGVGLGLSIVQTVAERHHATITVESEPGQGTTVRLIFPLADPDETADAG